MDEDFEVRCNRCPSTHLDVVTGDRKSDTTFILRADTEFLCIACFMANPNSDANVLPGAYPIRIGDPEPEFPDCEFGVVSPSNEPDIL